MKTEIRVFDVSLRDGLQNEPKIVPLKDKMGFAEKLTQAGILDIEVGAFVRKDRVPQMADSDQLFAKIRSGQCDLGSARTWSLVPNQQGLERAIVSGASRFALFTAATDSFTLKNIPCLGNQVGSNLEEG